MELVEQEGAKSCRGLAGRESSGHDRNACNKAMRVSSASECWSVQEVVS